ncbi:MAG: hypothetical protein ABF839_06845 [Acetobacter orientalis]|uniref:hypothetical protein n=1 Tax=Acetobacter orientalis TaxID=146474 RepID=UPI0039E89349
MANTFSRNIRLFADKALSDKALSGYLSKIAIEQRNALVRSGESPSNWITYVDGVKGAPEYSVNPDGVILYHFNALPEATIQAVTLAMQRSPVRSGRYRRAWLVVVNGKVWLSDLSAIPPGSEVMVLNPEPYARKIDTGGMKTSVPPGIVEYVRQRILRRFPTLTVERAFVNIPPGMLPGAPWILRRSKGHSKTRQAGQPITYPALILTEKE